jgi:hypothetical protein
MMSNATRLGEIKRELAEKGIRPDWDPEPLCVDTCPSHDGKRCERLGFRAPEGDCCLLAVRRILRVLGEEGAGDD